VKCSPSDFGKINWNFSKEKREENPGNSSDWDALTVKKRIVQHVVS